MDYPISVPSVGLVGGKFVDEDPLGGTPGSLIPAQWGNGVTDEILNVIKAAGLTPDELTNTQLLAALKIVAIQSGVTPGRLLNIQVFDTVGAATYTKTPGANFAIVDVQGTGGQGGGSPACAAGQNGFGTGGHSGARAVVQISLAAVTTVPVTIGAGGSSGAAGASGQTGQTTSFGTYVSCPGGAGGNVLGPTTSSFIGANAVSLPVPTISGVLKTLVSQSGNAGAAATCIAVGTAISGSGGISPGYGGSITASIGTSPGNPGVQVGSGGSGAFTAAGGAAQVGGLGIRGKIVVYDYA